MLWLILKYAFLAFIVWILWEKIIRETITWLQLRKQGVVFMGGFPPITDLIKFGTEASKDSTVLPFTETLIKYLGNPLPNLAGMVLMGTTFVFVNKAELLEDFYVKKNMNYSKAWIEIKTFAPMVRSGPFAQRSEDPNYVPQRKILSQAFFKQKMTGMIEIIKSSTIELARKLRENHKDGDVIDFIKVSTELMSTLIVNVCVGHGRAYDLIDQKDKNGAMIKMTVYDAMIRNTADLTARTETPMNIFFPMLNETVDMPWDADFKFNLESLKAKMQTFTDERNKNPNANEEFDDILQYLLKDDYYSKNQHEIVDILISFFLAGAQTQQVATANMVYYLEMYPQHKKRLLDLIHPITDKINDFQNELTLDVVEDFDYIRACFNESMRMEPPAFISAGACFNKDTTAGGIDWKADQTFFINIKAIHNDPRQWREPTVYNPDRFDSNSEWYKRPDGGIRSPFAFAPFLGGKRICLGKSLVDMAQKFTIPILLSAFDFQFADPETQSKKKPQYQIATHQVPEHKFKLIYRREI